MLKITSMILQKNSNTLTINTTRLSYDESYNMGWQNRSTNYQFPIDTTKTDKHLNIKEKQQTIKKDKNKEKLKYGKKSDWKRELLQIIKILQDNSVDVTSIPTTKRRVYTILKDIRQEGVDIESIIKDNQLDENYKIGQKLNYFRLVYKGTIKRQMSDEEKMMAEELGIVEKNYW